MKTLILAVLLSVCSVSAFALTPNNKRMYVTEIKGNPSGEWHGSDDHYMYRFTDTLTMCNASNWGVTTDKNMAQVLHIAFILHRPVFIKSIKRTGSDCYIQYVHINSPDIRE